MAELTKMLVQELQLIGPCSPTGFTATGTLDDLPQDVCDPLPWEIEATVWVEERFVRSVRPQALRCSA